MPIRDPRNGRKWVGVVSYYAVRGGERRRLQKRKAGFATKREAADWEASTRLKLGRERPDPLSTRQGETLIGYLRAWNEGSKVQNRPSTVSSREYSIDYLESVLADVRLSEVTTELLEAALAALVKSGGANGQGLSAQTVLNAAKVLSAGLRAAHARGKILANPVVGMRRPKVPQRELQLPSADELRRLLEHQADHWLGPLWLFVATTGLRRGEVLGLRWSDVDLERGEAQIRQAVVATADGEYELGPVKTDRSRRTVVLLPEVVEVLRGHRKVLLERWVAIGERPEHDLVFPNQIGGPLDPPKLSRLHREACQAVGIKLRFHDLRHAWASAALRAGVPLLVVSRHLGHADVRTTADTYGHVDTDDLKRAAIAARDSLLG